MLSPLAIPFYWFASLPSRISEWRGQGFAGRDELISEHKRKDAELLMLRAEVQKMASMSAEIVRLRELLNSSAIVHNTVSVAELIGVSPDPTRHYIVIDKGAEDGIFAGQPVLDSSGLMGQVIDVASAHSRVLLISDTSHVLPVQVNRNGVRAMAEGSGRMDQLLLRHVPVTTDIKVGDLLVSSGLGGRFPAGYPSATVTEVTHDPGQAFATIKAVPKANLNRSRYVLLVFSSEEQQVIEE